MYMDTEIYCRSQQNVKISVTQVDIFVDFSDQSNLRGARLFSMFQLIRGWAGGLHLTDQ